MVERLCIKVIDEQGTLCNQPIPKTSQSKFCELHKNPNRCKTRKEQIKRFIAPKTKTQRRKAEQVLVEQARSAMISEILALPKIIGFREATFVVLDSLKMLVSRIGTSNLEYDGDDE